MSCTAAPVKRSNAGNRDFERRGCGNENRHTKVCVVHGANSVLRLVAKVIVLIFASCKRSEWTLSFVLITTRRSLFQPQILSNYKQPFFYTGIPAWKDWQSDPHSLILANVDILLGPLLCWLPLLKCFVLTALVQFLPSLVVIQLWWNLTLIKHQQNER